MFCQVDALRSIIITVLDNDIIITYLINSNNDLWGRIENGSNDCISESEMARPAGQSKRPKPLASSQFAHAQQNALAIRAKREERGRNLTSYFECDNLRIAIASTICKKSWSIKDLWVDLKLFLKNYIIAMQLFSSARMDAHKITPLFPLLNFNITKINNCVIRITNSSIVLLRRRLYLTSSLV